MRFGLLETIFLLIIIFVGYPRLLSFLREHPENSLAVSLLEFNFLVSIVLTIAVVVMAVRWVMSLMEE